MSVIFTDDIHIIDAGGENVVYFRFKSGGDFLEVAMPEFVAEKVMRRLEEILNDPNDDQKDLPNEVHSKPKSPWF